MTVRRTWMIAAAATLLGAAWAPSTHAGARIGIGIALPLGYPYYRRPVYYGPAPVYVQPAPVYVVSPGGTYVPAPPPAYYPVPAPQPASTGAASQPPPAYQPAQTPPPPLAAPPVYPSK